MVLAAQCQEGLTLASPHPPDSPNTLVWKVQVLVPAKGLQAEWAPMESQRTSLLTPIVRSPPPPP